MITEPKETGTFYWSIKAKDGDEEQFSMPRCVEVLEIVYDGASDWPTMDPKGEDPSFLACTVKNGMETQGVHKSFLFDTEEEAAERLISALQARKREVERWISELEDKYHD